MPQFTRRTFSAALAASAAINGEGQQVPPKDRLLAALKPTHPRIMAGDRTFDGIRNLLGSSAEAARWHQSILRGAEKLLSSAPSEHNIADGRRLLAVSRQVKERVQVLALAYKLEGDRRFLGRAWRELEAAARFKDWNPSHFLDTAEMTYAFGIMYDWLFADWNPGQQQTLREAIVRLGLLPGMEVYRSKDGWHRNVNNWNQVCNGGLGVGALAIANEEPALAADILSNGLASLPLAMEHYGPDGAGTEGATYWDYGARFNILFLASLESALGTDFGFAQTPGFADSGLYQMYMAGAGGMALDFEDCGLRRLSTPMHFWMARKFRRPEFSWFRWRELARQDQHGTVLDLLWYDDSGRNYSPSKLPLDKYFRRAECVSIRSAWADPNALVVALQAGDNNSLRGHRSLDLGTFILESDGVRWFIDSGVEQETYMGHRHHNPRWSYYRIRAEGHNTLVINPDKGPDQNDKAVAKVTRFESALSRVRAEVDLTAAYARKAREVRRTLEVIDRRVVLLTDLVRTAAPADIWWFAHTEAKAELSPDGRRAALSQNGKRLLAELRSPGGAKFEIMDAKPLPGSPDPQPQETNEGRRKLTVHLRGVSDASISVRFLPG